MVQWLRIHLPAQGTRLILDLGRSHMRWSSWAHVPQLLNLCCRSQELQLLKSAHPRACAPRQEKSLRCDALASQQESSPCSRDDPAQSKNTNQPGLLELLMSGCQFLATDWLVWNGIRQHFLKAPRIFLVGSQGCKPFPEGLEFAVYQICPSWLWHPVLFNFSP